MQKTQKMEKTEKTHEYGIGRIGVVGVFDSINLISVVKLIYRSSRIKGFLYNVLPIYIINSIINLVTRKTPIVPKKTFTHIQCIFIGVGVMV